MNLADRVSRIFGFFRGGYPTGMPATGYVPLAALLPRRLSGGETTLATNEMPLLDDIKRIQRRFDAIGFPRVQRRIPRIR